MRLDRGHGCGCSRWRGWRRCRWRSLYRTGHRAWRRRQRSRFTGAAGRSPISSASPIAAPGFRFDFGFGFEFGFEFSGRLSFFRVFGPRFGRAFAPASGLPGAGMSRLCCWRGALCCTCRCETGGSGSIIGGRAVRCRWRRGAIWRRLTAGFGCFATRRSGRLAAQSKYAGADSNQIGC